MNEKMNEKLLYVSADGDDNAQGSFEKPLGTLDGARIAVRRFLQSSNDNLDIRVLIRGGLYKLSKTVVFGLEDSGKS
jgi:hypothetical protein